MGDRWHDTPIYHRDDLCPGDDIPGPALIIEATGTNAIEPHWHATFTDLGALVLRHRPTADTSRTGEAFSASPTPDGRGILEIMSSANPPGSRENASPLQVTPPPVSLSPHLSTPDPVRLEIFNNLFRAIAEEMGVTLQNTSTSVNIKERLDFSCAIFDAEGNSSPTPPIFPSTSAPWAKASKA
jgi:5-oxoprolinase (ATP-hydrolysing)